MPSVAFVSYRFGGRDGVSVESAKWMHAFSALGFSVFTVAGEGTCDHLLPGLALYPPSPPNRAELIAQLDNALEPADLVVAENICSLPINSEASAATAATLLERRAILHHHDLALERDVFAHRGPPPDAPNWLHVTVSNRARVLLLGHGFDAKRVVRIYNHFDTSTTGGDRHELRSRLGAGVDDLLFLHPTRAIERKNVPDAITLCEGVQEMQQARVIYWLLGEAEDGYGEALEKLVASAGIRVVRGFPGSAPAQRPCSIADAYAASDVVLMPSTWEGFGNPAVEGSLWQRPCVVGHYPVAEELRSLGFRWFSPCTPAELVAFLASPDASLLRGNRRIAAENFNVADLPGKLASVLGSSGWRL